MLDGGTAVEKNKGINGLQGVQWGKSLVWDSYGRDRKEGDI